MALAFGTKLGPYEIQSPLGAGGMGEVYRARDTRLDRTVAIKILPTHLSEDPEAKQRLEREARAISSLNHSNICHLYDVGRQDGIDFIVMEFLEGETLADRLRKGPLQQAQVLKYGIEICDGLDLAHRSGVVHRDLKPGNIMLTKAGAKLMDFGLAKRADALKPPSLEFTASLSSPAAGQPLTAQGTVVGTFQYISPEQLQGREADARSDIFALGAVLYEMATGKRAFSEKSTAKLIAAILEIDPPPISTTQPTSPPALDRVVKSCLSKDPDNRWQNAHDLGSELRWIEESTSRLGAIESNPNLTRHRSLRWFALAVAVLALAGLAGGLLTRKPERAPTLRVAINIPAGSQLALSKQVVLSPDGRLVAMILADVEGKTRLWIRQLDLDKAQPVAGTEGAMQPFWSPDSQSLGFFTFENSLKKITLSGGMIQALCDAGSGTDLNSYGGTWNRNGVIVFSSGSKGLYRIPASGGTPSKIAVEGDYRWPSFLPDGRHLLVLSNGPGSGIFAVTLEGGPAQNVLPQETNPARYADPGYVLFARQGNLLAQPFNLRNLQVTGSAVTVAESVEPGPLSFSEAAGMLLHVEISKTQLAWVDREGNRLSTVGEPGYVSSPYISPNGNYAIATVTNQQRQKLWMFDFQRDTANPFTLDAGNDAFVAWSSDSKQVAFSSIRENGQEDVFLKPVSGGGEQPLLVQPGDKEPDQWSPDGRFLLFDYRPRHDAPFDIWVLPTFGDRKPYPFIQSPGTDAYATFSPDGRWVAYQSSELGQTEIYVVPFPGPGGRWQVSKGGGGQPFWPQGKELFYVSNDFQMIGVEFEVRGKNFLVGKSRRLFERQSIGGSLSMNPDAGASIDVNRDGTRWLVAAPVDERNASPLILTTNWISESRK